jgi:4-amino-4-deoxy-L-arabinose transferase-like glycosyltransferase
MMVVDQRRMPSQPRSQHRRHFLIAAAIITIYLLQIVFAVKDQAQTIDEGFHLAAGYRYWQCADFGFNSEHPPLVKMVAAAPLWLSHTPAPDGACGTEPTTKDYGYGLGAHWYFAQGLNAEQMLWRGRLAACIFPLILAVTCFFFARELFGDMAALFALTLLAFEPTMLAHGALVTTDTAVAAFVLAAVFAFYRYAQKPTPARLIVAGLMTGLALSVKHSGVLVLPIIVVLALGELWRSRAADQRRGRQALHAVFALGLIVLIATGVLWTTYGWRFDARPNGAAMTTSISEFISLTQQMGNHSFTLAHVVPVIERFRLLPQAYLYGFVDVLNVSNPGLPPYILGKLYPHGKWFFFPVNFIIKSTLSFLALLLIAIVAVPWRRLNWGRQLFYLLTPVIVWTAIAMTSGLDIGYRHMLPAIPFLCILLGAAASYLFTRSRAWRIVIVALVVLHSASSVHAFPDYIPYSNEAWGGKSKTYRVLTDSNVDWGQAINETRRYLAANNIHDCWIAYDNVAPAQYYGVQCRQLPPNVGGAPTTPPLRATGTFILSDLSVSGIEWERPELNPYREFLHATPKAVIGGAMLVYEGTFDLSGAAAIQHIAAADSLNGAKQFEQAEMQARQGIALLPESVRGHLALANALAGLNKTDEARQEYEAALNLATQRAEWYPIQIVQLRRASDKLATPHS